MSCASSVTVVVMPGPPVRANPRKRDAAGFLVEVPGDNDRRRPESSSTSGPAVRPRCRVSSRRPTGPWLLLACHGFAHGACGLVFGFVDVRGDAARFERVAEFGAHERAGGKPGDALEVG